MEFFIYETRRAEIIVIKPLKQNHRNPEGVALLFKVLFVTHQNRYRANIFLYQGKKHSYSHSYNESF